MMNSNYNVHTKPLFKDLGDALIWKYRLASVGITIIKIRRYHDDLFFIMEIKDLERPSLYWDGAMGVMMVQHIFHLQCMTLWHRFAKDKWAPLHNETRIYDTFPLYLIW